MFIYNIHYASCVFIDNLEKMRFLLKTRHKNIHIDPLTLGLTFQCPIGLSNVRTIVVAHTGAIAPTAVGPWPYGSNFGNFHELKINPGYFLKMSSLKARNHVTN